MPSHRSRPRLARAIVTAAVLAVAFSSTVAAGGRPFSGALTGAAEAPGPGDPDGSGMFAVWINPGQEEICYELHVADILLPATGAHIHRAPAGSPGPVVVPLTAPSGAHTVGCASVQRDLALEILMNPEQFYVNVHTTAHPAGAIRGQLR